jgi:hypothetical protein
VKIRKVLRFTCDYCKKSNCKRDAMAAHEMRCFKNPSRRCPICERQWPDEALSKLVAGLSAITEETEKAMIDEIRNEVDGCPACVLAVIKQAKLPQVEWDNGSPIAEQHESGSHPFYVNFNYKTEMDEYMNEQRTDWADY